MSGWDEFRNYTTKCIIINNVGFSKVQDGGVHGTTFATFYWRAILPKYRN